MPTPRNPLPNTGPYTPPVFVNPGRTHVLGAPGQQLGGPVLPRDAERATPGSEESLVDILRLLYPIHADRPPDRFDVGRGFANNRPVADRQTLTMAASQHPLPGTGDWVPPKSIAEPLSETPVTQAHLDAYSNTRGPGDVGRLPRGISDDDYWNLATALMRLYPGTPIPGSKNQYGLANSQTIGDRPVTTMTNPLPNYSPLTMVKGQAAAQLRTLINHALAQRGLSPLINTPLPVGATQMGRM